MSGTLSYKDPVSSFLILDGGDSFSGWSYDNSTKDEYSSTSNLFSTPMCNSYLSPKTHHKVTLSYFKVNWSMYYNTLIFSHNKHQFSNQKNFLLKYKVQFNKTPGHNLQWGTNASCKSVLKHIRPLVHNHVPTKHVTAWSAQFWPVVFDFLVYISGINIHLVTSISGTFFLHENPLLHWTYNFKFIHTI
jgi:hypothetical protein